MALGTQYTPRRSLDQEHKTMRNFLDFIVRTYALAKTVVECDSSASNSIFASLSRGLLASCAPEFRDIALLVQVFQTARTILVQEKQARQFQNHHPSKVNGRAEASKASLSMQAAPVSSTGNGSSSHLGPTMNGSPSTLGSARVNPTPALSRMNAPSPGHVPRSATINRSHPPYHPQARAVGNEPRPSLSPLNPGYVRMPQASGSAAAIPRVDTPNISQNSRKRKADPSWETGSASRVPRQTSAPAPAPQNGAKRRASSAAPPVVRLKTGSQTVIIARQSPQATSQNVYPNGQKRKADPSWEAGRDAKRPNQAIPSQVACCWVTQWDKEGRPTGCCDALISSDRQSILAHLRTAHQINRRRVLSCSWGYCVPDVSLTQENIAEHIEKSHLQVDGSAVICENVGCLRKALYYDDKVVRRLCWDCIARSVYHRELQVARRPRLVLLTRDTIPGRPDIPFDSR
ncbi:hypothetical protein NMY22_g15168 [Coprinellus aureogranulatus]|nr:hypothetical protein NMY22_g15168 [Coprinellus aureogranulatus]